MVIYIKTFKLIKNPYLSFHVSHSISWTTGLLADMTLLPPFDAFCFVKLLPKRILSALVMRPELSRAELSVMV